jgi:hypothetical protein
MLRLDKLVTGLRSGASNYPGVSFILCTEDGACLAASDDRENTQTVSAAVASIFIEFRAAESTPLESVVFRTEQRLVCCRQLATLSDGMIVLFMATVSRKAQSSFSADEEHEWLQNLTLAAVEDLGFLREPLAAMTKRFNE